MANEIHIGQSHNLNCGHGHLTGGADGDGVGARAPEEAGRAGRDRRLHHEERQDAAQEGAVRRRRLDM